MCKRWLKLSYLFWYTYNMVMYIMKEYFNKFCIYYLNNFNKSYYKKIVKNAKKEKVDYAKIDNEAKEYTRLLREKLKEFNYKGLKREVYEMINKYIKIKDDMDEGDKKIYLEILNSLCIIYGINLRNELKDYVTELMNPKDVYKELFKCYLEDKSLEEIEIIRKKCKLEYFEDVDEKASNIVKEVKRVCKKYNYVINNKTGFNEAIKEYIDNKDGYTNNTKSEILKMFALVANVYEINLKEVIKTHYMRGTTLKENKDFVQNPLENDFFLQSYLLQRYYNCSFNIKELAIPGYYKLKRYKEDNYYPIQAKLMKRIISIYLDKINNYGTQDINPLYVNILSIEDLSRIDEIKEEELITFAQYINKRVEEDIVLRKLNVSDVLYHFLHFLVNVTDIYSPNIGDYDKNVFLINNKEENIAIHIGANNDENAFKFLAKYIIKCIENNISYNMKNSLDNSNSRERIVLLTSKEDLCTRISILDEIFEENTSMIEDFDKPIVSSALFKDKYFGLSDINVCGMNYNTFLDNAAEVAYYRVIAKLEVNVIKNEEVLSLINSFIELTKVEGDNPLESIYNGNSFKEIKDVINRYITEVSKTLDIYVHSKEKILLLINEFKKSLQYIVNISRGNKKNSESNIAININDIAL